MIPVSEFRPVFDRVCEHFGVAGKSKEMAWKGCFYPDPDSMYTLKASIVDIYRTLDRTKGPWRASRDA